MGNNKEKSDSGNFWYREAFSPQPVSSSALSDFSTRFL